MLLLSLALIGDLSATANAQQNEATLSLRAAQYQLSRLAAGQLIDQATFPIDSSNFVTIEIIATVGGIETSITGPAGQVINPNTVESLGGSFTSTHSPTIPSGLSLFSSLAQNHHYIYSFPSQGAGNYVIRFQAPANLAEEVPVMTEVTTDSPIAARLFATEATVFTGRPAVLSAALFSGQTPIAGANVTVTLKREGGSTTAVTLRDDANPADAEAGDGLYSGEFTPTAAGKYSALAVITGIAPGGSAFTRHSLTELMVLAAPGKLTGTAPDHGVDSNGDALVDSIAFDVGTETIVAGTYRAFVHLKTASGKTLVGGGEANLLAGSGNITVKVDAADIRETGEGGPYFVTLIELDAVETNKQITIDHRANVGQTQAYLFGSFQRDALTLTGVTSDQGIDTNGNGRYDRLRVTVQVDVRQAGLYRWNMKLTDQNSTRIDFAGGQGFLVAGLNNMILEYNGFTIGSSGAPGPFRLEDMLLFGPKATIATTVGQTQAYRSIEFEGGQENSTDVIAPGVVASLSSSPNAAGWNNSNVTVTLNASDNQGGSGVQNITYSASGAQPVALTTVNGASGSLTISAEGTTTVTFFARDVAGNSGAPQTLTLKIDKTAPAINISSPAATLLLNQAAAANYTCSDGASSVGSCVGSVPAGGGIDTSAVGLKHFTVTATDMAGNTATRTLDYTVSYGVRLKYDLTKAHLSGSTVPVKIQLVDANGVNVSNQYLAVHALGTSLVSNYAPGEVEDAGNANPDNDFRFANFDGEGGYIFNLQTTGLTTGTYVLIFIAGADPLTHGAQFQVK